MSHDGRPERLAFSLEQIENVILPEDRRKNSAEKRSSELSSNELVRQAKSRAKRPPISVDDLFLFFGNWSPYYLRVIMLTGMMWMVTDMHDFMVNFLVMEADEFVFRGVSGIEYDSMPGVHVFRLVDLKKSNHTTGVDSSGQVGILPEEVAKMLKAAAFRGGIAGLFYCAYNYTTEHRWHVLKAGLLYVIAALVLYSSYIPSIRIALFFAELFSQTIEVTVYMHAMQSVPGHLRPMVLLAFQALETVGTVLFNMSFRVSRHWWMVGITIWPLFALTSLIYYRFCPNSLLMTLINKNTIALELEIRNWTEDEIDTDAIIDDNMFMGRPVISLWEHLWELLSIKNFSFKLFVLIFLHSLRGKTDVGVFISLDEMLGLPTNEKYLTRDVYHVMSALISAVALYWISRRTTVVSMCILATCTLSLILIMPRDMFNFCDLITTFGRGSRAAAYLLPMMMAISSKSITAVCRLMILEHIPVQLQLLVFPLALIGGDLIDWLCKILIHSFFEETYPAEKLITSLLLMLVGTILALFLDDGSQMPLTSCHCQCYYMSRKTYSSEPTMNDDTEFDASIETTYSE